VGPATAVTRIFKKYLKWTNQLQDGLDGAIFHTFQYKNYVNELSTQKQPGCKKKVRPCLKWLV